MAKRLRTLWLSNGKSFLVIYLKESVRLIQKQIAGHRELSTDKIPMKLSRGLPRLVPGSLRLLIEDGDSDTIKAVLTVLSLYRVILVPSVLKLETITDPFKGISEELPIEEIRRALSSLRLQPERNESDILPSYRAGPNNARSILGLIPDAIALGSNVDMLESLNNFNLAWGNPTLNRYINEALVWYSSLPVKLLGKSLLGRFGLKPEAAGKVRVFAIVDGITQSCLKGLHDSMFQLLKQLPMDGTFDQSKPLEILRKNRKTYESEVYYSFDLSAATDRFPIKFQSQVLSLLFDEGVATYWMKLLINRDFSHKGKNYRYSVGQPMGALSSWAVFSFSHHIVVQIAALRVGQILPFRAYALLGDDIVIVGEAVAMSYLYIMRD